MRSDPCGGGACGAKAAKTQRSPRKRKSRLAFGCSCSESKVLGVLFSLGREEINDIVEERGSVEVCCEYCGQAYQFDRVDVGRLFSGPAVNPQVTHEIH